jgi:hypothetical protein
MSRAPIALLWGVFAIFFAVMTIREIRAAIRGLPVPEYNLGFSDMNEAEEILRTAIIKADPRIEPLRGPMDRRPPWRF